MPSSPADWDRVALPDLPGDPDGTRAGTWQIVLRLIDRGQVDKRLLNVVGKRGEGGLPYSALVHCYSNLVFDARLEQTLTAAVWHDGGGQGDPGWNPCALLLCLTGERVLGERAAAALREAGIDVDELRRCLERSCR
jgi:hypothetical protein